MLLGERYQIQTPIVRFRNGSSIVYRGRDAHMNREVAIKMVRDIYTDNQLIVRRFEEAASAVLAMPGAHPHVVQVYDYGHAGATPYLIMEFVDATNLRLYQRSVLILPMQQAISIAHAVALGLHALHSHGMVHKGIQPEHLLLGQDGIVKITPFSVTWGASGHYYAPEQLQNEGMTPASDIYSLGSVIYEMLTGHRPFEGDNPAAVAMRHFHEAPVPPGQLNPGITPPLEKIILRCLEKAPAMRYQDGMQLAHALETLREA